LNPIAYVGVVSVLDTAHL